MYLLTMKIVDDFLDKITMYRLVLYYLLIVIGLATLLSFFNILHYSPLSILFSTFFLVVVGWITNTIFSSVFDAPTNIESVYITTLILALIITPIKTIHDLPFLGWAAVISM